MNHPHEPADFPPDKTPHPTFVVAPPKGEAEQTIGDRLRAARIAAGLTQQQLAGETFSKGYISAVERARMIPSVKALRLLAERLGRPISYFLGEQPSTLRLEEGKPPCDERQANMLSEAEKVLQQGGYEEAITLFEPLGRKERTAWAHEAYAHFLADQGRYQEAYEHMRLALNYMSHQSQGVLP